MGRTHVLVLSVDCPTDNIISVVNSWSNTINFVLYHGRAYTKKVALSTVEGAPQCLTYWCCCLNVHWLKACLIHKLYKAIGTSSSDKSPIHCFNRSQHTLSVLTCEWIEYVQQDSIVRRSTVPTVYMVLGTAYTAVEHTNGANVEDSGLHTLTWI